MRKWIRHLSLNGSLKAYLSRIDWRRRDVRDAAALLAIAVITFAVAEETSLFEKIYQFVKQHENWDLDDFLIVSFVLNLAMIIFGFRRMQDLAKEINTCPLPDIECKPRFSLSCGILCAAKSASPAKLA